VNLSEEGSAAVMEALSQAGIGIEAGLWDASDVARLVESGFADRVERVLMEPVDMPAEDALRVVHAIEHALDEARIEVPRLQHGDGDATWVLVENAIARGLGTRVGFEDTFFLPNGDRADGNAALIAAARAGR
jgi:uncharacterized protein (DUF849 family)